jgi:hypothetical protein
MCHNFACIARLRIVKTQRPDRIRSASLPCRTSGSGRHIFNARLSLEQLAELVATKFGHFKNREQQSYLDVAIVDRYRDGNALLGVDQVMVVATSPARLPTRAFERTYELPLALRRLPRPTIDGCLSSPDQSQKHYLRRLERIASLLAWRPPMSREDGNGRNI